MKNFTPNPTICIISILSFFATLLPILSHGQNTGYFSTLSNGYFREIHATTDGGFIGVLSNGNIGGANSIIKWSANLTKEWDIASNVGIIHIIETNDHKFISLGYSNVTGRILAIKLDTNGSVIFTKEYRDPSGSLSEFCLSKAVYPDNGFVWGGGQCVGSNYMVKCNENGNVEWQHQYLTQPVSGVRTALSIYTDSNSYYLLGQLIYQMSLVKIDTGGNSLLFKVFDFGVNGIHSYPWKISRVNANEFVILINGQAVQNWKLGIICLDNNLQFMCSAGFSSTYGCSFNDFVPLDNGDLFLAGKINLNNSGRQNYLMMRLAISNGSLIWQKQARDHNGNGSNMELRGVAKTNNGKVVAVGTAIEGSTVGVMDGNGDGLCSDTVSNIQVVALNFTISTAQPYILPLGIVDSSITVSFTHDNYTPTYYCGTVGLENEIEEQFAITLYPNPTTNQLNINLNGINADQVSIYNSFGQLLLDVKHPVNNTINISQLETGVYFAEIKARGETQIKKWIKL